MNPLDIDPTYAEFVKTPEIAEQIRRLKNQVEMLQGIVDGLQIDKKTLTTQIVQIMKDDSLIKNYISEQLEELKREAEEKAFKRLSAISDKI